MFLGMVVIGGLFLLPIFFVISLMIFDADFDDVTVGIIITVFTMGVPLIRLPFAIREYYYLVTQDQSEECLICGRSLASCECCPDCAGAKKVYKSRPIESEYVACPVCSGTGKQNVSPPNCCVICGQNAHGTWATVYKLLYNSIEMLDGITYTETKTEYSVLGEVKHFVCNNCVSRGNRWDFNDPEDVREALAVDYANQLEKPKPNVHLHGQDASQAGEVGYITRSLMLNWKIRSTPTR